MAVQPGPGRSSHHGRDVVTNALTTLAGETRGTLVTPDTASYHDDRSVWNGMIDLSPAGILFAAGVRDVVAGVQSAARHGLDLAIRGGGHNVAGNGLCDGGLVIDLSRMNRVEVDPTTKRARVGGGALLQDVDAATQQHGLVAPSGVVSTTGVGGLTLGGGFGWLSRSLGLAIDNLISAELVTASGEVLRASADDHPDLFWALRGGGGNFGVVTEFEFALHQIGTELFTGLVVHPMSEAGDYLRHYRDVVHAFPEEMTAWTVLRRAPPLPFLGEDVHGQPIVITAFAYRGGEDDGRGLMRPLLEHGTVLGSHVGMTPFVGWQQAFDPLNGKGARNFWKSHNLQALSDGAIDTLLAMADTFPSESCEIFIVHLGGAVNRVPEDATAYAHRDVEFLFNTHTRWMDSEDDERAVAWARELYERTKPFSKGVYVNFLSVDDDRMSDIYSQHVYERLRTVKRRYDPDNLFRRNHNIVPA